MRTLYLLIAFPAAALAVLNGHCSGSAATGIWAEYGICIETTTCSDYHGVTTSGACPNDGSTVKCCVIGQGSSTVNPCGGSSWCGWTANGCSGTEVSGHCPGGSNFECCKV